MLECWGQGEVMEKSMSGDATSKPLHVRTPLIESYAMSQQAGFTVYLKLENTQPTATFKLRGIGYMIQKAIQTQNCTSCVCSSGGNAGMAAAYAARRLNIPISIIIPGSTPDFVAKRLEGEGAKVIVHGDVWDHANEKALELAKEPGCLYIHPFDHPDVWDGHASMMVEVSEDLGYKPDVVILSVGGGGLMSGVLRGMEKVGWQDVPLVAMETIGADCFNQSVKANKMVAIPDITSVAKCLGSLVICQQAWDYYQTKPIISEVITDKQSVEACVKFANDHRMLVEPACGAALAAIYSDVVKNLQTDGKLGPIKTAVLVVCGGQTINLDQLEHLQKVVGLK